jgi:glycosyltransferase involved in cell wall biosynthesis
VLAGRLVTAADGSRPLPNRLACREFAEQHGWPAAVGHHRRLYATLAGRVEHRRLSVVYVGHCAQLSGAELALERLLRALPEIDAHVILAEDGPLVGRLRATGASVEVSPMPDRARVLRREAVGSSVRSMAAAAASIGYAVRLARRLRALRPDLVHTNSLKAALYGSLAARLAGVPVVWHAHDRIADDYLPSAAVRLVRGCARWLPNAIIANSAATLATFCTGAPPAVIIPSPVDVTTSDPIRDGRFTVGIVGRLAPWKGQDVFLRAFAAAFPNGSARAVLVGAVLFGEVDFESELKSLARQLGIASRVEFRGFRDDVPAELARMDVLVHCSTVPEPFGQVVVEGMAAGVPVVAAGAGGPAEVVSDGVDGMLYPPGDVAALVRVLQKLAQDDTLRARLAVAGQRRAQRFRPEAAADQVMTVYRDVTRRARRGRRARRTIDFERWEA